MPLIDEIKKKNQGFNQIGMNSAITNPVLAQSAIGGDRVTPGRDGGIIIDGSRGVAGTGQGFDPTAQTDFGQFGENINGVDTLQFDMTDKMAALTPKQRQDARFAAVLGEQGSKATPLDPDSATRLGILEQGANIAGLNASANTMDARSNALRAETLANKKEIKMQDVFGTDAMGKSIKTGQKPLVFNSDGTLFDPNLIASQQKAINAPHTQGLDAETEKALAFVNSDRTVNPRTRKLRRKAIMERYNERLNQ